LHVVSTSQRTASELEKQHRRSGWNCAAVDALPTALARAIQLGGYSSDVPLAAVDWGWSRVTLCIVLRGEAVFVRSFARGALATLVNPLRQKLNLTEREARTSLADVGVGTTGAADKCRRTQAMVAQCLAAGLGEFQEELQRTFGFLRSRHRTFDPRGIVLFGGGAMLGNIAPYVSEQLELDAAVWNYPHVEAEAAQSQLVPLPLLGPAVALSALAWESQ
jgi:Tfp pilus assembly PilM family ATPase